MEYLTTSDNPHVANLVWASDYMAHHTLIQFNQSDTYGVTFYKA